MAGIDASTPARSTAATTGGSPAPVMTPSPLHGVASGATPGPVAAPAPAMHIPQYQAARETLQSSSLTHKTKLVRSMQAQLVDFQLNVEEKENALTLAENGLVEHLAKTGIVEKHVHLTETQLGLARVKVVRLKRRLTEMEGVLEQEARKQHAI